MAGADDPAALAPDSLPGALVTGTPAPQPWTADLAAFLERGGFVIWAIAALSVVALAIILWKLWRFSRSGAWRRARAEAAVARWLDDCPDEALQTALAGHGSCARLVAAVLDALHRQGYAPDLAAGEATRIAKNLLAEAGRGLRALELIATIAPLLGLLGTVLGMIAAFQALQQSGAHADPAALAGGIWEALLTTAAGMTVAIPVSAALAWFDSVIAGLRRAMEDMTARVLTHAAHRVGVADGAASRQAAQ